MFDCLDYHATWSASITVRFTTWEQQLLVKVPPDFAIGILVTMLAHVKLVNRFVVHFPNKANNVDDCFLCSVPSKAEMIGKECCLWISCYPIRQHSISRVGRGLRWVYEICNCGTLFGMRTIWAAKGDHAVILLLLSNHLDTCALPRPVPLQYI